MSTEEIVSRGVSIINKRAWKKRKTWEAPKSNFDLVDSWHLPISPPRSEEELASLIAEAYRYLDGDYNLLNISFKEPKMDWHLDPQTGKRTPLTFGLDVNYRDASLAGNVKNIWEKNRHHHLTVLALAYVVTKDKRYAENIETQLLSWKENNPFPLGINWSSSLELGVRLISWVWIERLLRGSPAHANLFGVKGVLWSAMYWSQWMISRHYSRGSSANNHLVGEMAGLYMASLLWPFYLESDQWNRLSQRILEQEAERQTFPSGLNREQAFSYHIFSLEFFLLCGIEGERFGKPFPVSYKQQVKRMLEVIPTLLDVKGNLPCYGDGDEGMALQLRPLKSSRLDWLFRCGRQWLEARVPLPIKGSGVLASTIIWPNGEDAVGNMETPKGSVGFEDAGIFILSSNRGGPKEIFCLADAGPHGFLSIAAHGHADALSFTLSAGGFPIIIDPGTYSYHADPIWREYFRGTKAHNTITVDNLNQSVSGGAFLWTQKTQSKLLQWKATDKGGMLEAEHNGYTRLPGKVIHRRKLALEDKRLEIVDHLKGNGDHSLEWRLHFSPMCVASIKNDSCVIEWSSGHMIISLNRRLTWTLIRGGGETGWYSSGFNIKEPTYTLTGSFNTKLPISLENSLEVFFN